MMLLYMVHVMLSGPITEQIRSIRQAGTRALSSQQDDGASISSTPVVGTDAPKLSQKLTHVVGHKHELKQTPTETKRHRKGLRPRHGDQKMNSNRTIDKKSEVRNISESPGSSNSEFKRKLDPEITKYSKLLSDRTIKNESGKMLPSRKDNNSSIFTKNLQNKSEKNISTIKTHDNTTKYSNNASQVEGDNSVLEEVGIIL